MCLNPNCHPSQKSIGVNSPVSIPLELSYLKTRRVVAKGIEFIVPQGIVRIDQDSKISGTHGWQVRRPKHCAGPSKFFSDTVRRVDQGPAASLKRALDYLVKNPPPAHVREYPQSTRAGIPTGVPGVRVVLSLRKTRNIAEVLVEASSLEKGKAGRRFYCGTMGTITEERLRVGIEKAIKARQQMQRSLLARRKREIGEALELAKVRDLEKYHQRQQAAECTLVSA